MRTTILGLAALLGTVSAVAGCGTSTTPGTATPTSSSDASLPPGTPNVAHPLDTTRFQKDPCGVLTPAQLRALNVAARGEVDNQDPTGPACGWTDTDGPSKMSLGVGFLTAGHGLGDIYAQKDLYAYFQPLPDIEGYPAVANIKGSQRNNTGTCAIDIGVTNQLAVDVFVTLRNGVGAPPDYSDPCPRTQKVADAIVKTLKGES